MRAFIISFLAVAARGVAAELPMVSDVNPAAFEKHVRAVAAAIDRAGTPWTAEKLDRLIRQGPAEAQRELDPDCFAALSVAPDGALTIIPNGQPALLEQGWRTLLLKVLNPSGRQSTLRLSSPNSQPVPGADPAEVAPRWLGLDVLDRAPLSPNLSGLPLEYRVAHLWADAAGTKHASFTANLGKPSGAEGMREWRFASDAEGWQAIHDGAAQAVDGRLRIEVKGIDPILTCPVTLPPGEKLLRFRARNGSSPTWQIFWWTEGMAEPDGRHSKDLTVFKDDGGWNDYSLRFTAEAPLAGLRIDPGGGTGICEIDDIELIALDEPGADSVQSQITFSIQPSREIRFSVQDENGQPCMASFEIKDSLGRLYPWPAKRLAPDFFFQPQIYRADGESVRLPFGTFDLICRRGPESIPEVKKLAVPADGEAPVVEYRVRRWIDPSLQGWFSGDHHIHAAGCQHYAKPTEGVLPEDMQRHITGEDLKVGCNLTWGPCFDFQKQFFTGRIDKVSTYPYLLRYDVEVSGFGSHQSGHLCLLRLKEQIIPGGDSKTHWPTLGLTTLRWAKAQGAITGPAHSAAGLRGEVSRIDGAPDGPDRLPNFAIPTFENGIGANEYVVDITHDVPGPDGKPVPAIDFISTMDTDRRAEWNMWYHTLNAGFRVRASGETDFPCITGRRVGDGRIYVFQKESKLDFDDWCEGIRDGRSYVSDGSAHFIDMVAGGVALSSGQPELNLKGPGTIEITSRAAVRHPDGAGDASIELIVNGYPVDRRMLPADGVTRDLRFSTPIDRSSWIALRTFPSAHTNPIFVIVAGQPVRPNRHSVEWLSRCVDQAWRMNERTYRDEEHQAARAAYDHARAFYRKRLDEMK